MNRTIALLLTLLISSCHLTPFARYTLNKKGFKNFSKKEKLAGNKQAPERDYRVAHYDWDVTVDIENKSLAGSMEIGLVPQSAQSRLLLDMQARLKIDSITSSRAIPIVERKGDLLYLQFTEALAVDEQIDLRIYYHGKPLNIIGQGPLRWKEDELGRPWISTMTEGIGPHFMMPCCALLGTEAARTRIAVTVPRDLVVASNGRLTDTEMLAEGGLKRYVHEVSAPINIYNISFNIGHFKTFNLAYTDINAVEREIKCQVLDYHLDTAKVWYQQTLEVMRTLEEINGGFPFWEDGCRFIESNFSAMEHQSGIAMGGRYNYQFMDKNMTLIHELAHEWWGNSVSATDYADMWIHEGIATYMEALVVERIYGPWADNVRLEYGQKNIENTIPIRKVPDVLYNSWTNDADEDIYEKGAMMMHSIRVVLDDDALFFSIIKGLYQEHAYSNITSEQFIDYVVKASGVDLKPLFKLYLDETQPPTLLIDRKSNTLSYRWKEVPSFYPQGSVMLTTDKDTLIILPTGKWQKVTLASTAEIKWKVEDAIYYDVAD